jgi:Protein of unknown function (DUF559)
MMGEVESARSADRVRVTPPKPGIEAMVENLLKDRARQMRREPTEAERRMWRLLRDRRLGGFKFRRQEQLGRYIVDFVLLRAEAHRRARRQPACRERLRCRARCLAALARLCRPALLE